MGLIPLFRLAYVIAYRRIAANWKLELAVALGILLAVALVAGGVIYSKVLEEAALQRTLTDSTEDEVNLDVRYFYNFDPEVHQRAESLMLQRVTPRLEPYYEGQSQWVRSPTFYFGGHPHLELAQEVRPRGKLQYIKGFEPHVKLVEGQMPADALDPSDPLEVIVETKGLELLGLSVGDQVDLIPAVADGEADSLPVEIAGAIEILDPEDQFWYGAGDGLSYSGQRWDWVPMFTPPSTFLRTLESKYPGIYTEETWFFYLDSDDLRTSDIGGLQKTLERAEVDVG
ncbi:MAG: hypothetical protein ACE5KI_06515, partial [Dehalococcoidia bacterium]